MNYVDFEYNGRRLSEYGCMVCSMLSSDDKEEKDIGNQIKFNTINYNNENNSNKFRLLSSGYENAYSTHLEICKSVCNENGQTFFTDDEAVKIIRWLNQKKFHKFRMIYEDGQFPNIYYNGSFNVKPIVLSGKIIGMSLDFTSDAPFGYYEPIQHDMDFSEELPSFVNDTDTKCPMTGEYILYDQSDEAGYIYPDCVEIEILEDGNLMIHNSMDDEDVVINNCVSGETITLNCKYRIIKSDSEHPGLYNDFNYHFLRIINNYDESDENDSFSKNIFTVSLKCRISFSYSPIAKIGVI